MKNQGIVSDVDVELPQTMVDTESLNEEKKLAKYSKTQEFKRLKTFLEARIEFYRNYLPGGDPLKTTNIREEDLPMYWKIACIVVTEFQGIISEYEQAKEVVENAKR